MKLLQIGFLFFVVQCFGDPIKEELILFECPESDGLFAHPEFCDKYYVCVDDVPSVKSCPNGLVFDDLLPPRSMVYPCVHMNSVDCCDRKLPIPNNSTPECPYEFETKAIGLPTQCNKYRICSNGVATDLSCPENLAYSSVTGTCQWADLVEECDASAFTKCEGCKDAPDGTYIESIENCTHYFVCYNKRPRWFICSEGRVFDPCRADCVKPEDVKCGSCKIKKKINSEKVNHLT